jgi:hypothetical protein
MIHRRVYDILAGILNTGILCNWLWRLCLIRLLPARVCDHLLYHVLVWPFGNKQPQTLIERNERLRKEAKGLFGETLI